MLNRRIWFMLLLLLLSSFPILAAKLPRSEKEIPIYPSSVRNTSAEKELISQYSDYDEETKKKLAFQYGQGLYR